MSYETLLLETRGAVALVTVNRPEKMNALNAQVLADLKACFGALRADAAVKAVVLTGAGEKAFVAGADISELAGAGGPALERMAEQGQALMWSIENLGKPVIAAINGFALGGGCELALACTFRYAADTARLGLPEITLGLIPGYGGTQRLPRLVGRGRALEMILTGGMTGAQEALAMGLVNKVLPQAELLETALATAGRIAGHSAGTIRYALKAVNEGLNSGPDAGQRLEAALFGAVGATEDAAEGCRAFLEKRKPAFKDA
ncbi:MAG TPA: enoyl-CoA hydratase-related protein [Candidatus Krumholzibacteria bacterium]|nr:enoyl-CoA hydratase-related protein [Candidatus Krumholzibacteria bacterium]